MYVHDMVPLSNYIGLVDLAPTYRHSAGRGLDPAGVVVGGRGRRRRAVRSDARLPHLADWAAAVVRLVGRLHLSPVQRHPASRLGCRLRFRDPDRLSHWLRRARRNRGADRTYLALRISDLGGNDGKLSHFVELDRATRRIRAPARAPSGQRSRWAAGVATAALDGARAHSARALFCRLDAATRDLRPNNRGRLAPLPRAALAGDSPRTPRTPPRPPPATP